MPSLIPSKVVTDNFWGLWWGAETLPSNRRKLGDAAHVCSVFQEEASEWVGQLTIHSNVRSVHESVTLVSGPIKNIGSTVVGKMLVETSCFRVAIPDDGR